jgi:ubiquinone/menaquinone biosynthesis C-methylase UbiE
VQYVVDQIHYLDQAAASDPGRAYKQDLLAAMRLSPGLRVLDAGCGPGTDLAAMADAVGTGGTVLGLDRDPAMATEAHRRLADRNNVHIGVADAHALPLPSGSIDRARTDRVLQHVTSPAAAVAELGRTLRPGGLLALAEPDWDTLVIDAEDVATSRSYTAYVVRDVVRNATIGRSLARLAHEAGLCVTSLQPVPVVFREVDLAEKILGLSRVAQRAVAAGALPPDATTAWLKSLSRGPFFATFTFFVVVAVADR